MMIFSFILNLLTINIISSVVWTPAIILRESFF